MPNSVFETAGDKNTTFNGIYNVVLSYLDPTKNSAVIVQPSPTRDVKVSHLSIFRLCFVIARNCDIFLITERHHHG